MSADELSSTLKSLNLRWMAEHLDTELADGARKQRSAGDIIHRLVRGEHENRVARSIERRFHQAKLPRRARLDEFDFTFPAEVNADQIRHLFSLRFLSTNTNIVFIGNVGVGKTHLAIALATKACEQRKNVLFVSACSMLNDLTEARKGAQLGKRLRRYLRPELLVID